MDEIIDYDAVTNDAGPKQASTAVSLIAGSIGGATQVLVGQPLDTIKTRAQIAPRGQFKGPVDIAMQTIRKEGFLALYKGMMSPLLGVAAVNSLLFGSFAVAKRLVSPYPELTTLQTMAAGGIAGGVTSILASPVELFKIRMQGQYGQPGDKRLSAVTAEMWRDYGFRNGIMRGFWVTVAREVPAYAGFYAGYETTKKFFARKLNNPSSPHQQLPVWALLTSGAVGGVAYWTACYPLDVLKSKVQMADKPPTSIAYLWRSWSEIAAKEGWATFMRGLSPTYIRSVPAAASTFAAFELASDWLQNNTSL